MLNFTQNQKQTLSDLAASGTQSYYLAYDPTLIVGTNPETIATGNGLTEFYREDAANLVEVIYTSSRKFLANSSLPIRSFNVEQFSVTLTKT